MPVPRAPRAAPHPVHAPEDKKKRETNNQFTAVEAAVARGGGEGDQYFHRANYEQTTACLQPPHPGGASEHDETRKRPIVQSGGKSIKR